MDFSVQKVFLKLLFVSLLLIAVPVCRAATFTAIASGAYNSPATWSFVGADADGIPDNTDDVTIPNPFTVNLTVSQNAKNLTINPGGKINLGGFVMLIWGNLVQNGTSSGSGTWQFRAVGTYSGNPINNSGSIYFYTNYTIAAGVVLNKSGGILVSNGVVVTNNGSITLVNNTIDFFSSTAKWKNMNGSSLAVGLNIIGNGTIDAATASNTVTYQTNNTTTIYTGGTTQYYDLKLSSTTANTKKILAPLSVHDLTINSTVTLNCNNQNLTVGGNWTNNANTNCQNMTTVTFNGSGTQLITRSTPETFNNVTMSGTGTVKCATGITINGTTNLNSGTFDPDIYTAHIKGATFNGNGGAVNTAAVGLIVFDRVGAQTLAGTAGTTFGNVQFNNGALITLTIGYGGAGNTTLTNGTFDVGAFNWTQSGSFFLMNGMSINTAAAGTIVFTGSSAQTIGGASSVPFGNLTISSSSTVSPSFAITVAKDFTITSGTYDVTASNYGLNIAGNFTNNGGTFTPQSGTVTMNGAAAQTISGTAAINFFDLTSTNTSGGVTVPSGLIIINDILSVSSQSFGTSGAGTIILPASTATSNGKIATLGAGASLVGTGWTVQAFINGPATAYWQFLGSPINATTLADWDNDPRFYMSGVSGNDGNACCPVFHSVRTYNTATNSYSNVTTTATALTPGKGFMIWMADNMQQLTAPLIFDTKGKPNFGNVTFPVSSAGSAYNLVSNPYACPISFASVVAASGNLGPNFSILQENGTYTTNPNGGTIAATQGFMCIATSTGNMTFTEACKSPGSNPNIIRMASEENMVRIRTTNDMNGLGGETCIQFADEAHNGFDLGPDMMYLPSPYDGATNVWSTDLDGKDLMCNALDSRDDQLTIPVTVIANTQGKQTISFSGIDRVTGYSCAWLEDMKTGAHINLSQTDNYSFDVDQIGEERDFLLHFERTGDCSLHDQNLATTLESATQVYVSNDQLRAKFFFDAATDVQVNIYDAEGREVSAPEFFTVTGESVNLSNPGAHGVYFVQIIKGQEVVTKKIYY
ncbi:MAG TPA: T9SS type A sorting domain-containing protein [Bacteroidia bacterium]|jgi:hypothetical protein|nr:T9SS type A sorting domain-containing protein [Bacteroidia bacterium]